MKWKQEVVITVYIIWALLNNIKDNKNTTAMKVNYTRVFNVTFIAFITNSIKIQYKQFQ